MPIKVYRQLPSGEAQRIFSSSLLGNPISGGGPQVSGTLYDWLFAGSTSALLWGNAWGLITNRSGVPGHDGNGLPTSVAWLPPDRISVQDDEQQPENPLRARVYYQGKLMNREELVHLPAFALPGRLEAISPIRAFAMLWGQGLDALKYTSDWFINGGFPPGTFQNINEEVDSQQAKEIRRMLTDTLRERQPLVYGRDWDYKPVVVPQDEAVFIKSMQLNATQVAAIFGVQPYRVGGTRNDGMTYSNVTQNLLDELQSTLKPWLTRWEHLLTGLLPSTQYAKFDVDALLKMDPHTRTQVYQIQRNIGTRTANEIRAEDDMTPVQGGDDPIALPVLERIVGTTRSLPNSIMPLLTIEAEYIAKLIETMESEHPELVNPAVQGTPPINVTPESYLMRLITQVRSGPLFGRYPDAHAAESDRKSAITMLEAHAKLGHLTPEEASVRISRARHAGTTGDLAALFEGLPLMKDGAAPSVSRETFGPPEFRASDRDRARASMLLELHAREGRLRGHEKDERMRKASEAVTLGDLATLFADLPVVEQAASTPEEHRTEATPLAPLFGPAALAALRARADGFQTAGQAALNGKAH
jgi:HK97 family phage portal protein